MEVTEWRANGTIRKGRQGEADGEGSADRNPRTFADCERHRPQSYDF